MKLLEHYITEYRNQKKELTQKNELWRLNIKTEEEFIDKLENILVDSLFFEYINDFQRKNSVGAQIHYLLKTKKTKEEWEVEIKRREEETEIADKEAIPVVRGILKTIKTPLEWEDIVRISKMIWRRQIKFENLQEDLRIEFMKTKHYEKLKKENKLNRKTLDE